MEHTKSINFIIIVFKHFLIFMCVIFQNNLPYVRIINEEMSNNIDKIFINKVSYITKSETIKYKLCRWKQKRKNHSIISFLAF